MDTPTLGGGFVAARSCAVSRAGGVMLLHLGWLVYGGFVLCVRDVLMIACDALGGPGGSSCC